jgi:hypothetical protein
LASCIQVQANCAGLFGLTGSSTDTLQAALYIAQHPGAWSGTSGLYGLIASPASPYTPPYGNASTTLSAEPNDWTLAISYTGAGLGIDQQADFNDYLTNLGLAIDINGNLWATASAEGPNATALTTGTIAGFDPTGAALTLPTSLPGGSINVDSTNGYSTYGGFGPDVLNPASSIVNIFGEPNSFVIDRSQHIWVSNVSGLNDQGGSEVAISSSAAPGAAHNLILASGSPSFNLPDGGNSMAIDSAGNLWQTVGPNLNEFSATGASVGTQSPYPATVFNVCNLTFDTTGTLWGDDCGAANQVFAVAPASGSLLATYNGAFTATSQSGTLAPGAGGNVVACNAASTGYMVFNTSNLTAPVNTFSTSNGRCGQLLAMDGAGNVWSYAAGAVALDAVNVNGSQITPDNGLNGTSNDEVTATGLAPFNQTATTGQGGLAIDRSGNLWFLNGFTGTASLSITPSNALVEFVGVAAPTVTPVAVATQNSAQGTKP